jgi:hypothetical protein
MSAENRVVFVKALAARALDVAVIDSKGSSGFADVEWSAALISAAYESKKPVAQHSTGYLIKQKEWIFGDLQLPLSNFTRRLLVRQLHRVMAAFMDRPLQPKELRAWVKKKRAAKQWVSSAKEFEELIEELVVLSQAAVPPAKRPRVSVEEAKAAESDDGMTDFSDRLGASSDQGVTDWGNGGGSDDELEAWTETV